MYRQVLVDNYTQKKSIDKDVCTFYFLADSSQKKLFPDVVKHVTEKYYIC